MADAGRTALVSGAARGIGAATAARLVADGWRVVVLDREEAGNAPGRRVLRCDVSREDEVASAIDSVRVTEGRLDALVCNAGFGINKKLAALTLDEWNSVLGTN